MTPACTDRWGVPVRARRPHAVEALDAAVEDLVALAGAPGERALEAAAEDPTLALAQVFLAYLDLYATTQAARHSASARLAPLESNVPLPERERRHVAAARAWHAGELEEAAGHLESALRANPRDLLALKVAQDLYFFLGDRGQLRASPARVLSAWSGNGRGRGYVEGMLAFGLEENGAYDEAWARVTAALAANPRDVWSVHAGAHVFEMRGDQREGIQFLADTSPHWVDSFFAAHNWWHRALFHVELGDLAGALELYDAQIGRRVPGLWLELVDAASLLWRLDLHGVDVRARAEPLAAWLEERLEDVVYAYNDWHMAMAFALSGRGGLVRRLLDANRARARGTNRRVLELVGLDLIEGFLEFSEGRHEEAAALLGRARPLAAAVGGSNAQRDVVDLTLLGAAAAGGDAALVGRLLAERAARKASGGRADQALVEAARTR